MRAIAFDPTRDEFRVAELPVPEPGTGDVLVRVESCGLNPVDAKIALWKSLAPDMHADWQLTPLAEWLQPFRDKHRRTPERPLAVEFSVAEPRREMHMDPYLMGLALSNLLVNACRHASGRRWRRARASTGLR